jgi:glycerate kinase
MADGGEGTLDALVSATGGEIRALDVLGPLGKPVRARFGLLGDGRTAVLEMASASGLALVPTDQRDPSRTTTWGTGELLLAAAAAGARRIILGIGGSATNDGGAGLAQALGFRLLDGDGQPIGLGGGSLAHLARIDADGRDQRLAGLEVAVACDVDNPLCGPRGASAVYGPQKGATPEMIARLDENLRHFAHVIARDLGRDILELPGAGAAGGLGGGLVAFADGRLEPGVSLVIQTVGLADRLRGADLCLTGEGAVDASSAFGKTAVGVARLARSFGCPVLALAGTLETGYEAVLDQGIDAVFSICPGPITLEDAVARAGPLLERAAEHAVRAFLSGRRHAAPPSEAS